MVQQEFNPFVFDGKLLNRKGIGLLNYQLSMLSIRKGFMVLQDTTGTDGAFNFIIPEFNDSLEIEFKAKALKGKEEDYLIQADPRHFPLLLTPPSNKSPWDARAPGYLEKISRYQFDTLFAQAHGMLPAVTVSGKGQKKVPARADKANIINRDQLLAAGTDNVANLLLTIPGVHLNNGYLVMRGVTAFYPSPSDEPIVMMDGSQVNLRASGDAQNSSPVLAFLRTLNAREIESIRVLNGTDAAEFGVRGGHGVIEVTTSPMTYFPKETIENKKFWIEGYRVPKAFAGREYSTKAAVENQFPDNRTTIYWNGELVTDSQGSNSISFYTGDIVTDYIITIAGISSKGEKIYKTVILRM
jgi:hypothetical protein